MTLPKRGKFVVVDGMDGSGKGTQLALLRGALKDIPVVFTREPGGAGSATAEFLRTVILDPEKYNIAPTPLCDLFLFWASRAQHIQEVVESSRAAGRHVISDRYDSSTFAFQIYGEQKPFGPLFRAIRSRVPAYFMPDAYIILDLPAEVAFDRVRQGRSQEMTRFDQKPIEYHERVRAGFRLFKQEVGDGRTPGIVRLVDANRTPQAVHADLAAIVRGVLAS